MIKKTFGDNVTLYNGDCLDVMREMEAGSVDCVVTDIPYGIGENNKKNLSRINNHSNVQPIDYGNFDWDDKPASPEQISEIIRVSKNQVIFGGIYVVLPPSSSWIVWDKLNTGDFADCELAWTSHKKAVRKISYMWNGMIKQKPEKRYHPTQKPAEVMRWTLTNYTKQNDIIFDPFMGSGTTIVAGIQLGYTNLIGVELDKDYFEIACNRIHDALQQPTLWSVNK